jgi:hypothetical protein
MPPAQSGLRRGAFVCIADGNFGALKSDLAVGSVTKRLVD